MVDSWDFVIIVNGMTDQQEENKRDRRRAKREQVFGPECLIASTSETEHTLECGHVVGKHSTERVNIKRKRCCFCKE